MQIFSKIQMSFKAFIDPESRFFKLALLLFFFTIIIFSCPTCAIGDIHFGSLEFHPFFNAMAGYVDNVYLAPEEDPNEPEESSTYRLYSSGLRCDWNKTKYRIQLSYHYEYFEYDISEIVDKGLFDLDSQFDLRFGKSGNGINLDGGYRYRKTSDPYTSEQRANDRKEASTKFGMRFNLKDRFGISLNSELIQHRFIDDLPAMRWNQDMLSLNSKASMRPFTKTDILFEYGLILSDYKDPNRALNDDSKTHSLLAGLEWEATAKLSGFMKAGYQWKKYNRIEARTPDTWKIEVDLRHAFSEFTTLQLTFERDIEDSDFKYASQDAGFYYSNRIQLALDHKLTSKIETMMDIFYNYTNYNNVSRKDKVWQLDLGINYQFLDWIRATFKSYYRMRNIRMRNTNINVYDAFDYETYQVNIGLNLIF